MSRFSKERIHYLHEYVANLKPGLLGRFFYYCVPYRRSVILDNMRRVFAEVLSEKEIQMIAKGFYRHLALTLWELVARELPVFKHRIKTSVSGAEPAIQAIDDNKQVILLVGHFGNWEIAAASYTAAHKVPVDSYIIRKKLRNKFIEKRLFKQSNESRLQVLTLDNITRKLIKVLRSKAVLAFVMDQRVSPSSKQGIPVEFFGEKVGTYNGLAKLVKKTNAVVIPFTSYRDKNGVHQSKCIKPLEWISADDPEQEVYLNTRHYNQVIEEFVLDHPDQWLWSHKRWKQIA